MSTTNASATTTRITLIRVEILTVYFPKYISQSSATMVAANLIAFTYLKELKQEENPISDIFQLFKFMCD